MSQSGKRQLQPVAVTELLQCHGNLGVLGTAMHCKIICHRSDDCTLSSLLSLPVLLWPLSSTQCLEPESSPGTDISLPAHYSKSGKSCDSASKIYLEMLVFSCTLTDKVSSDSLARFSLQTSSPSVILVLSAGSSHYIC